MNQPRLDILGTLLGLIGLALLLSVCPAYPVLTTSYDTSVWEIGVAFLLWIVAVSLIVGLRVLKRKRATEPSVSQ